MTYHNSGGIHSDDPDQGRLPLLPAAALAMIHDLNLSAEEIEEVIRMAQSALVERRRLDRLARLSIQ